MKFILGLLAGIALTLVTMWMLGIARFDGDVDARGPADDNIVLDEDLDREDHSERLRRSAEEAGEAISDAATDTALTARVKTALAKNDLASTIQIDVDTDNRLVTLSGVVGSAAEVERAIETAKSVEGVREVVSSLQVEGAVAENE